MPPASAEAERLLPGVAEEVDEVIDAIGFGRWTALLVLVLGLLYMSDSVEATLLSFLSGCVGGAFDLSDAEAATVISIVFAGEVVGAAFAGPIADQFGRKGVSLVSGFGVGVFGLASAFSDGFDAFVALRFFVGVFIGTGAVPYDLIAEQIPASMRGRVLMSFSVCWAVGALYVVGAAWVTLPVWSWRALAIACALPPLAVGIALAFVINESPRFLLEAGRRTEAADVLRKLAARNGVGDDKRVEATIAKLSAGGDASAPRGFDAAVAWDNMTSLFDDRRSYTTCAVWIVWFSFGLLYYGITLLVTRFGSATDDDDELVCKFKYGIIFVIFSSELVGSLVNLAAIDIFGRVKCATVGYLAAAVFLIPVALDGPGQFANLYFALAFATAASSTSWVHVTEVYSTDIRSTAHTLAFIVARFGAFLSGYVVDNGTSLEFATTVLIVAAACAAGASATLPETTGERLS